MPKISMMPNPPFPRIAFFLALALAGSFACSTGEGETDEATLDPAQQVVDRARRVHGSDRLDEGRVAFDFRDRHYVAIRQGGRFQFERIFTDSSGARVRDVLRNEGLVREVEGEAVDLPPEDSAAYANSVNGVIYFALLPYALNDPAVRKTYLGEETIGGVPYDKVRVTFRAEGGGKDHEDEFVYWFHRENHTLDYFAYNYLTDGGGARFREAINPRVIDGIRFVDYINYEPLDDSRAVEGFAEKFTADSLRELSRIINENITFRPLNANPS